MNTFEHQTSILRRSKVQKLNEFCKLSLLAIERLDHCQISDAKKCLLGTAD
ncbi:hypothetical protein M3J09_012566 [Ascochyta lentis]